MPENNEPILDFKRIHFPTDSITIGQLRQENPEPVDERDTEHWLPDGTLWVERILARRAFVEALGQTYVPSSTIEPDDREMCIEELSEDYVGYGLSQGLKTTEKLVEAFESEARTQALEYSGKNR